MKTTRQKDPKSRILNPRSRRILAILAGTLLVAYLLVIHIIPRFLDLPYTLTHSPHAGLQVTDRDGSPLRHFLTENELRRDQPATLEEIPQSLIDATLAAEDSRFHHHNGIDFPGVLRAARDAALHRKIVSGASTISQQLIKISSIPKKRNLQTKITETLHARRLEQLWDKPDILTAYLNRLPYGNQLTGCRAAARGYFSKPLADLSLAESAFLAGLPNKPTRYNPNTNFPAAQKRQRYILGRMLEEQLIDEAQHRAALAEPIRLIARSRSPFHAPHLVELVKNDVPPGFFAADRTIRTTLDSRLQNFAQQTLETRLQRLDERLQSNGKRIAQGAVVVIDNATGEVLALAGSRDFFSSPGGQINGAWIPRSPGSALKPFTYLLALEQGHTAASILADVPVEYPTATGTYRPVNFDRRHHGPVTLRHSLANSLNIPAVRLLDEIGGPAHLHQTLQNLGLTSLDPDSSVYGLGITLGTAEVRLLELTNAYATLARLGEHLPYQLTLNEPRDPKFKVQDPSHRLPTRLFPADDCYVIADILSDNRARADAFGLNSPLHFSDEIRDLRVAAKTGTSTDFRDNWCLGFTPDYTIGVWVGRFDNAPMRNISGVSGAGPVFHDIMLQLYQNPDRPPQWYAEPDTFAHADIDSLTGKRPAANGAAGLRTHREIFRSPAHLPPVATADDYDSSTGKSLLPTTFAKWLKKEGHHLKSRAGIRKDPLVDQPLPVVIVSPVEGTTACLDPDLPDRGSRFPLEATGVTSIDKLIWHSETLIIDSTDPAAPLALLTPGHHRITVHDPESGREHSVTFLVENL